jgi:hypothetical protein
MVLSSMLLIVLSCVGCKNCSIESNFELAPSSRLPKWLNVPTEYSRKDVTVEIFLYTSYEATITAYGPGHKKLTEVRGTERYHPITAQQSRSAFPRYIVITVDGMPEVFEHKQRDNILSITDDPKIIGTLKSSS